MFLLKKVVEPGNYIHFGLENNLKMLINNYSFNDIYELNLLVNVDGLPLFKSSSGQVIPILVTIINIPHLKKIVLPVGLYYGLEKPSDMNIFLDSFISEIVELSQHGITNSNGILFSIKIVGFVCDAPAKKDLLGIKGHGGYFSCTKCTVRGSTVSRKRVFTELNCTARTHEDFINWADSNYRLRDTALVRIPEIHFVNSFILDPMHLIYLGVMRTMLTTWYQGNLPYKLSQQLIKKISDFMEIQNLPEEFIRKPRALKYLLRWKATEFRSFLLYTGPVATKGVLDRDKYNNFMTLNVAISILLNPNSCGDLDLRNYARQLLMHFIQSFIKIYDESFITHNFHGLIHLVDDADYFSSKINEFTLDKISAFPFENYLQKIKSMVRGRNKPLEQIGNRMAELFCDISSSLPSLRTLNQQFPLLSHIYYNNGALPLKCVGPQYKKIHFPNFSLKIESPNNCCGLECGDIVMVENICNSIDLNCTVIIGRKFLIKRNFFEIPCSSSLIGVYEVEKLSEPELWPISFICKKYVYFKHKHNIYVVFPLLHTA
uniref:Transposase domain-containing protein n=1 Tax=Schizaphis graminum TaxID=13262 RepID=A0A2S2NIG0_SCHGA